METRVNILILRAPGTNCDMETAFAFEQAGAQVDLVHVEELIRRGKTLSSYQVMVVPGGFTYGDDISAGKILANELRLKLKEEIQRFVDDGRLILGICNGFQVLVKAGLLPTSKGRSSPVLQGLTLASNESGKFECRWVYLRTNKTSPCIFTRGIDAMYLPVAHGEGRVVAEQGALEESNVALYYADETGDIRAGYPHNPNGSMNNIAGICDATGRIFALMPHPERFIRWTQHPKWTRGPWRDYGDGFGIFKNAVEWAKNI
ncbi:MAG: phosphoribosylformylglycinamidine synthase I [Dehalococcoidia bacterium]